MPKKAYFVLCYLGTDYTDSLCDYNRFTYISTINPCNPCLIYTQGAAASRAFGPSARSCPTSAFRDYLFTKGKERRAFHPLSAIFFTFFSLSWENAGNALWGCFYMYKMLTGIVSLVGMKLFH